MTSLKTWSNGSTSKRWTLRVGLALLGLALLGSGCATQNRPAPPPLVHGTVDLEALTRQHPGWSGVGRYDAALRRLENAARSLPPTDRPDQKIATLPALPLAVGNGAALPFADAGQVGRQLLSTQQSLLDGLRSRRDAARLDQLQSRQSVWERDARQLYPLSAVSAMTQPDLDLQLLQANIAALTKTVEGWRQSEPPSPKLEALRAKVEADRARLERQLALRLQTKQASLERQEAEVRRVEDARAAYVQTQGNTLAAHLRAKDEYFITEQQRRLTAQRVALLAVLARPVPLLVPDAGAGGTLPLPQGPGAAQAALSRASLMEAEMHLNAQRTRWIRHLYDDTKAAAQDTADQHRWIVTFGPPQPGERDLTQPLAQALRAGNWQLSRV